MNVSRFWAPATMPSMTKTTKRVVTLLVVSFIATVGSACAGGLRSACEKQCYEMKSSEPRDFDDCLKRCQR